MESEMNVISFYESGRQTHWLAEIGKSDWRGGAFLYTLLRDGTFFDACGAGARVLMLTQGDRLISFCTYVERDDIPSDLKPWMGFVYTFPQYRGHRYMQLLFDEVTRLARQEHVSKVYISTGEKGLYEKYGCKFIGEMPNKSGVPARIYAKEIPSVQGNSE